MNQQKHIGLLLDCLHQDISRVTRGRLAALSPAEWEVLLSLTADQRVRALLYHQLKTRNLLEAIPDDIHQSLQAFYRQNARRNLIRLYHELHQIGKAFQAASTQVIILKGAYLAAVVYQNIALRELIDIDLLVHKEDLAQAAEIIMEMGYQPLKPFSLNWELTDKDLPRFMKAHATSIDLHWSITTPGESPRFDILDFWDQVSPVEIAKTTLLSLSPVDVLLHLCFHNAYGHQFAFSLRPYCDIQAVIRHIEFGELNWDIVIERANRWGWGRGVYLSLRLAGEFVGAEIPEYVLDTLKPEKQVEEFYVIAKTQTLSNPALVGAIDPRIASYQQMPAWEKAGLLVRRFFPTKVEIANKYQISPDTPIIWLKYPVRWRDMFVNHWRDFRDVQGGDEELTALADKKGKIIQWLSASDES